MRVQNRWLNLVLVTCAVAAAAAAAAGLFLLSGTADFGAQAGQWLLTVAVAFAVTGALSPVVRQIDQRRSEREAWHAVLHDLVVANQKVEMARLRLLAHRSARSYQEQFGEFMDARVDIRRINAMRIVVEDRSLLPEHIDKMQHYLDALGRSTRRDIWAWPDSSVWTNCGSPTGCRQPRRMPAQLRCSPGRWPSRPRRGVSCRIRRDSRG
jgi:hypothetical protein